MIIKYEGNKGLRLDKYLAIELKNFSRSQVQRMIKDGSITVNGEKVKSGFLLNGLDQIEIKNTGQEPKVIESEKIKLNFVYEDEKLLVIDKPAGMVVHPTREGQHFTGTVVNALLDRLDDNWEDNLRPGIVHRLDKDTSGLLIVAKNKTAYDFMVKQFKNREVEKHYIALVVGELEHKKGVVDSPIARSLKDRKKMSVSSESDARRAVSKYEVIDEFIFSDIKFALLDVEIETGRTHQIRVHMAAIAHPVVGDNVYGKKKVNDLLKKNFGLDRQFLHASSLKFKNLEGETVKLTSKLPEDLDAVLDLLRDGN